ncbi:MAG: hypothetical protein RL368_1462 [Pseudomonadota bacterium]|jgi:hypothetical protein
MRLLTAHKIVRKYPSHTMTKTPKIMSQPYVRFLQSWILLALLFTFLFSVSNVMVYWITPYLPLTTSNEQNVQVNHTHTNFNAVLMPQYASCIPLNVELSQNLDKILPLLQIYINAYQKPEQMYPLCIIPNKTQTVI